MLTSFTVEVAVLGYILNLSDFARFVSISRLPQSSSSSSSSSFDLVARQNSQTGVQVLRRVINASLTKH